MSAENVQVIALAAPPTAVPQPTAAPRPVQPAPAPVQPTASPRRRPPPSSLKACAVPYADNTEFGVVTFWGRLGPTGSNAISGGYRMKITSSSGGG